MKAAILVTAAVLSLVAGAASADPRPVVRARGPATQCLDTLGIPHGPVCHTQQASRIDVEPDICICGAGLREVSVPYCDPGEAPAPDSAGSNTARLTAAKRGDLLTARFEGRRFCSVLGRSGR